MDAEEYAHSAAEDAYQHGWSAVEAEFKRRTECGAFHSGQTATESLRLGLEAVRASLRDDLGRVADRRMTTPELSTFEKAWTEAVRDAHYRLRDEHIRRAPGGGSLSEPARLATERSIQSSAQELQAFLATARDRDRAERRGRRFQVALVVGGYVVLRGLEIGGRWLLDYITG